MLLRMLALIACGVPAPTADAPKADAPTAETGSQPSQACVRHGAQVGLLPRADVLLLPAQAVALFKDQETSGSTVIVMEREAEKVRVNSQSGFYPMPTIGPDRLLYAPVKPALLLGDLPLDRWRPLAGDTSAGSGALEKPANVRGLILGDGFGALRVGWVMRLQRAARAGLPETSTVERTSRSPGRPGQGASGWWRPLPGLVARPQDHPSTRRRGLFAPTLMRRLDHSARSPGSGPRGRGGG